MTVDDFFTAGREYLCGNGFTCQADTRIPGTDLEIELYAAKHGRSFGIFFPYEDCFFFHDIKRLISRDRAELALAHDAERKFVNSRYPLPKALRYKVPNIVTVCVSDEGLSKELAAYAMEQTVDFVGGERHQVILADLKRRLVISQGIETHFVYGVAVRFKNVSPINRAIGVVGAMVSSVAGE